MKKIFILFLVLSAGIAATAQTTRPALVRAEAVKTVTVSKEGNLVGYEQVVAAGRLTFAKMVRQSSEGPVYVQGYTVRFTSDDTFNNRKPVSIGLSKKSFDSVFTHGSPMMIARYPLLTRYASDRNLSLNDENSWMMVIKYFNDL